MNLEIVFNNLSYKHIKFTGMTVQTTGLVF